MTDDELKECLNVLVGEKNYNKALPTKVNSDYLIKQLLGFELGDTRDMIEEDQVNYSSQGEIVEYHQN